VQLDLIPSLSRPGGNVTGVFQLTAALEAKRFGLLHEMVPKAATLAALVNPNYSATEFQVRDVQDAAARLDVQLVVMNANSESDFDAAFATLAQRQAGGLLVCASPFFYSRREQLVTQAARHSVPADDRTAQSAQPVLPGRGIGRLILEYRSTIIRLWRHALTRSKTSLA
jgi:putative ABC transport system substrate-binding protein